MEHIGRQCTVCSLCHRNRLAIIERLKLGNQVDILIDQIADPVDDPSPLGWADPSPRAVVECPFGSSYRRVDVGFVTFGHTSNHFIGRGIVNIE